MSKSHFFYYNSWTLYRAQKIVCTYTHTIRYTFGNHCDSKYLFFLLLLFSTARSPRNLWPHYVYLHIVNIFSFSLPTPHRWLSPIPIHTYIYINTDTHTLICISIRVRCCTPVHYIRLGLRRICEFMRRLGGSSECFQGGYAHAGLD